MDAAVGGSRDRGQCLLEVDGVGFSVEALLRSSDGLVRFCFNLVHFQNKSIDTIITHLHVRMHFHIVRRQTF